MASTMPIGSGRSASGDRDSGTTNHAAASAATPTGMFTRKIGRQPQPARFHCTSTPPRITPATDAEPSTPPQTPKTFPRSWGGKVTWMTARICGTIRPAIAPSKNRADQHAWVDRDTAQRRRHREPRHAEQEHALAPEDVPEPAAGDQQRREPQHVSGHD